MVTEIKQTIRLLQPLTIELTHIKGHQDDKTATQDLSLPARLNIECDSRANEQLPYVQQHSVFLPHPRLPSAHPYLQINNKSIVRELPDTLRHATTSPAYKDYLEKKHDWTSDDSYEVNWHAIKLAMKHVKPNDRHNLHKYLHDWLPPSLPQARTGHRRSKNMPIMPTSFRKLLALPRMPEPQTRTTLPKPPERPQTNAR